MTGGSSEPKSGPSVVSRMESLRISSPAAPSAPAHHLRRKAGFDWKRNRRYVVLLHTAVKWPRLPSLVSLFVHMKRAQTNALVGPLVESVNLEFAHRPTAA